MGNNTNRDVLTDVSSTRWSVSPRFKEDRLRHFSQTWWKVIFCNCNKALISILVLPNSCNATYISFEFDNIFTIFKIDSYYLFKQFTVLSHLRSDIWDVRGRPGHPLPNADHCLIASIEYFLEHFFKKTFLSWPSIDYPYLIVPDVLTLTDVLWMKTGLHWQSSTPLYRFSHISWLILD